MKNYSAAEFSLSLRRVQRDCPAKSDFHKTSFASFICNYTSGGGVCVDARSVPVRDVALGVPSLNPLILPLGAQLSVNKGRECEERERRSGLSSLSS